MCVCVCLCMSMNLSLSLLQLRLLLLHPLHKHLPHFILSLLQLHQELLTFGLVSLLQTAHMHTNTHRSAVSHVSCTFFLVQIQRLWVSSSPDRFALWVCVFEAHLLQFAASVQLVVASVRLLSKVLHVYTNQHLPQLHKVTVILVLHWHTQTLDKL